MAVAEMPRPRTTSSLSNTTPPLAIAPMASSGRPGTPSFRTMKTSTAHPKPWPPHTPPVAPARQRHDNHIGSPPILTKEAGQEPPGIPPVTEQRSDISCVPLIRTARSHRQASPYLLRAEWDQVLGTTRAESVRSTATTLATHPCRQGNGEAAAVISPGRLDVARRLPRSSRTHSRGIPAKVRCHPSPLTMRLLADPARLFPRVRHSRWVSFPHQLGV